MERKFLDTVTVFENFAAEPKPIPLSKWLAACVKGTRFKDQVLEYRRTGNQEIKKRLPLVTVGAVCEGGRRMENVVQRTGWVCLDIDGKDNPGLNAKEIRDQIINIRNVAFSAISTGGAGVWALVKVKHPDRQAEYFEALKSDFQRFGIVLDSSKGRNPNDARFYSYDPDAKLNREFHLYSKIPAPTPPVQVPVRTSQPGGYGEKALKEEIGTLAMARKGSRNETLFKCAASLFELVAGGELVDHEVTSLLQQTALSIGLRKSETAATLTSAKQTGFQNPRSGNRSSSNHSPNSQPSQRSYPKNWDEVTPPQPGTAEFKEMEYYELQDGMNSSLNHEIQTAIDADPILNEIVTMFECEPIPG
ncbi:MAG: hypothetical protein JJU13_10275 [Balneolaceae bacterium]|nr:hypothetical protein [Balneolaceae bacterium]